MNLSEPAHSYPFHCPQCGGPTHGSATTTGQLATTYCEDCVGDRDIDDPLAAASNQ